MTPVGSSDWKSAGPRSLKLSWPLQELTRYFDLGLILNSEAIDAIVPPEVGALSAHHSGCWDCDLLDDNRLTWSGGVFDLFGLPRNTDITRGECVAFYSERSRSAMERLRAHAISNRCGFTLDAEIAPATGGARWIRIVGAPVCEGEKVVRLHGLKLAIS